MDDLTKVLTVVFGGIISLAIVSVIIGRNSQAPQAINSISGGLAKVVSAAVSPSNNGNNTFTSSPDWTNIGAYLGRTVGIDLPSISGFM